MNFKTSHLIIAFLSFIVLIQLVFIILMFGRQDSAGKTVTLESEGFEMTAEYVGSDKWEYNVVGELPNPCHNVSEDIEYLPGEVMVTLTIEPEMDPAVSCIQVIEPYDGGGEFEGDRDVSIKFNVDFVENVGGGNTVDPANPIYTEENSDKAKEIYADSDSITKEVDGIKAGARYLGNNEWEYAVTGEMPSACHTLEHEVLVAESFPEQVRVELTFTEPKPDTACILRLDFIAIAGNYSASENASFDLFVSTK